MCAEAIQPAAIVCPHCRHVQTTWKLCSPNITAFFTLCFIGAGIALCFLFINRIVGRQDFESFQSQITILESAVSQRVTSNAVYVVVTGTLTNGSKYSWKSIAIEGQLFDRDGRLVDTIPAMTDNYGNSVAIAHGTSAFKIESRTSHALGDYANHKLSIQWARDATSWP